MWIFPTYNRPKQCRQVIEQINSVGCTTPGIVIVNGTNCEEEYLAIELPSDWTRIVMPENIGACGAMNYAFRNAPHEPFYGLVCDDEYVFTPGWDTMLTEAAGSDYIAYGNDGWQSGKRQHGYVTWGGDLVRSVGFLALPGLWHWFHDDVWESIASALDLNRFCEDVWVEHRHYLRGKAVKDATYQAAEARAVEDRDIFAAWLNNEYVDLIDRLRPQYEEPSIPMVFAIPAPTSYRRAA